jgi:Uma2 family endonuclease
MMADAVLKPMTVEEFFDWCPKTDDRHWELIDGRPVAMAPTSPRHAVLLSAIVRRIDEALDRRPGCTAHTAAGIIPPSRLYTYYEADLAVFCRRDEPDERGEDQGPVVIVEILSPSTERHDRRLKLADYRAIPSVREVLLLDQASLFAEIHRRIGDNRWQTDLIRGADGRLQLDSIDLDIPLSLLYARVPLEEDAGVPSYEETTNRTHDER